MITERDIAEKFSVIWKQNFPMLTSNFMRVFNEAQVKAINSNIIPTKENVRYDIVSELAFNLAGKESNQEVIVDELNKDDVFTKELITETARTIWRSGNYTEGDLVLNVIEFEEVVSICKNILEFIEKMKIDNFIFEPKLIGFGPVPNLIADISIDDTLFEIKTVNRTFRSSDLKQLFIYLALKQVSGEVNWKYGGLYNPRKGLYCKFNVKGLVYNISGGKSTNESFENLLNSLSRDVEIDSKF